MSLISRDDILNFLAASDAPVTKRELARALNIKGDDRITLKKLLKDMEHSGDIVKQPGQVYAIPDTLPEIGIIEVVDIDIDGDLFGRPTEWDEDTQGPPPQVEIIPGVKKGHPALSRGDRALVRFRRLSDTRYEGHVIRRLDSPQGRVIGVVIRLKQGYALKPADKKAKYDYDIMTGELGDAVEGDLAIGEIQPARGLKRKRVRIAEVIGRQNDPKAISLIALHEAGIQPEFPPNVLAETANMTVPDIKGREDLRDIPLVTIDGADARDFDDAVFAEPVEDGFHLIVAIADVAHYVRHGSRLNAEAIRRGNSTYFPDRVVPMLPEKLSNDLCSLRPHENRACMAMHMWIDGSGKLLRHKIVRGIMRSAARLTYEQVQAAHDGVTDDMTGPLMEPVIRPLYDAYKILWTAREKRGALDLDLPERQIIINDNNEMIGVKQRQRLDAHKLIEEFMILANVAAAQCLEKRSAPCVYRVHDRPDPKKIDSAREFIESFGLTLPKGQVIRPAMINMVLHQAAELPYSHLVSQVILRAQAQAHYHPENVGHFGLALQRYAHFTSPIRRYADLLVHRSLIRAYGLGSGGLSDEETIGLEEMCQHISDTERLSMMAERNAVDRFTAAWLSERVGAQFEGRVSGVTRFGLFVELSESGADGLVPISTLPDDYYIHDEAQHALIGQRSGRVYRMGAQVTVTLAEADPLTGSTILNLVGNASADIPGLMIKKPLREKAGRIIHNSKNKKAPYRKFAKGKSTGKGKGKNKGSGKKGPR